MSNTTENTNNTNPEDWLTIELFEFLQLIGRISDEDEFESWKHDRCDLLKLVKDELDNL